MRPGAIAILTSILSLAALLGGSGQAGAQGQEIYLHGLTFGSYSKWTNCLALNDRQTNYQAVILPELGGRVMHYSYDLINILYQNPAGAGKTLANSAQPFYAGGYQCDLGPETAALPRRLQLSLGKHSWRSPRHYTVETASPAEPAVPVRIMKSFTMDHDSGDLGLLQRMANASPSPVAFSLRDRTVCKGGGFVFFKINPDSRFPLGCSLLRQAGSRYFYEPIETLPENVSRTDDTLIIDTRGGAAKIGADNRAGWIAYVRGNLLFVKFFPITAGGDYPDAGNTVSVMWNGTVTELSPQSPRIGLEPGGTYDFPERWVLKPLKREVKSLRDVRRILDEVPRNPFR
jgi:hypothetical protein